MGEECLWLVVCAAPTICKQAVYCSDTSTVASVITLLASWLHSFLVASPQFVMGIGLTHYCTLRYGC